MCCGQNFRRVVRSCVVDHVVSHSVGVAVERAPRVPAAKRVLCAGPVYRVSACLKSK